MAAKHHLYRKAFVRSAKEYLATLDPQVKKRCVFYGVKIVNSQPKSEAITRDAAEADFQFACAVQVMLGDLTPREIMEMFPVAKAFDGERYGIKDYFSTMKFLNAWDMDKPIQKAERFLSGYFNSELLSFFINLLGHVDDLRRLEGQPSMMEEFLANEGVPTYHQYTDPKGKEFLVNNLTGKTTRVRKQWPSYLRPVP